MLINLPVDEKQLSDPDELVKKLELLKKDIEEISILESKIYAIETINAKQIKTIQDIAIILGLDITRSVDQIVSTMQNLLTEAKAHEEFAIKSETMIKESALVIG